MFPVTAVISWPTVTLLRIAAWVISSNTCNNCGSKLYSIKISLKVKVFRSTALIPSISVYRVTKDSMFSHSLSEKVQVLSHWKIYVIALGHSLHTGNSVFVTAFVCHVLVILIRKAKVLYTVIHLIHRTLFCTD